MSYNTLEPDVNILHYFLELDFLLFLPTHA